VCIRERGRRKKKAGGETRKGESVDPNNQRDTNNTHRDESHSPFYGTIVERRRRRKKK